MLISHFEFFNLNDNPKNLSDDVTADTPKRTNHFLLLKQTQSLTLLVIQITPAAHLLVIHRSDKSIFEAIAGAVKFVQEDKMNVQSA